MFVSPTNTPTTAEPSTAEDAAAFAVRSKLAEEFLADIVMSGAIREVDRKVYQASPINGRRRSTKAELRALDYTIVDIVTVGHPMTCRQVFYQCTVLGIVPKTEHGYDLVLRRLTTLRLDGEIDFDKIADNTRWMRKPRTFTGIKQALALTAATYRRSLWEDADVYVEVWCEKDALAGVIIEETHPYDVPLMVARGFSSITYLYNAAEAISAKNKPAYIYHFGDRDPSGVAAAHAIENRLREFAPEAEIHFEIAAVTAEQIEEWNLPTRPTKTSDTRARNFKGDSVELDAIPSAQLRQLVRDCIEQHVDERALQTILVAEKSEREHLERMAKLLEAAP